MSANEDYFPNFLISTRSIPQELMEEALISKMEEYPSDPRLLLMLGAEYAQGGRIDEAEAAYIYALNRSPNFTIARFQLGLLQYSQQRIYSAFATWELLNELPAEDPLRIFKNALEALAKNEREVALQLFENGIRKNETNPPLNEDMQQFILRIKDLNESETEDAQDTSSRFFMSAYKNH